MTETIESAFNAYLESHIAKDHVSAKKHSLSEIQLKDAFEAGYKVGLLRLHLNVPATYRALNPE